MSTTRALTVRVIRDGAGVANSQHRIEEHCDSLNANGKSCVYRKGVGPTCTAFCESAAMVCLGSRYMEQFERCDTHQHAGNKLQGCAATRSLACECARGQSPPPWNPLRSRVNGVPEHIPADTLVLADTGAGGMALPASTRISRMSYAQERSSPVNVHIG